MIDNILVQLSLASKVVHQLEMTHDRRCLAAHEESLRQALKLKSAWNRTIAWQESRLLWLKEVDTSTCFFHVQASHHCRKNIIHAQDHNGQRLVSEDRKAEATFDFFDEIVGAPVSRACHINLGCLDLNHIDPSDLGDRFIESKIWSVIWSLPSDKAPGPDGFTGRFL
jgi:hypothetical protein